MIHRDAKKIFILFSGFLILEILSFYCLSWPILNYFIFGALILIFSAATIYKLEYGLLILFGELFIGSMGHLFRLDLNFGRLSIRIVFWAILMLIFSIKLLIQFSKQKKESPYFLNIKNFFSGKIFGIGNLFWLLCFFVFVGVINGLIRGNNFANLFADFNAWLYLSAIIPVAAIYGDGNRERTNKLMPLFMAGAAWLSVKTIFLLYIFTHNLGVSDIFYTWLRKTLVGEMTPTLSGWPRIFIQGQIFPAIAFFVVFWSTKLNEGYLSFKKFFSQKNIISIFLAALFFSSVLISFSRSFWVGFAITVFASLVVFWRLSSFKKTVIAGIWLAIATILGFFLIYLTAIFPYPRSGEFNADFEQRIASKGEAALASRWSLLPELSREIYKAPLLGKGFGATVTYFSSDPRVLEQNANGEYTTYAFEWGYLDIWLKIGFLGLLTYLLFLFKLLAAVYRRAYQSDSFIFLGLAAGIVFLGITNIFTPYLNHPLGIGFLLLSSCLIRSDRVY